MRRRRQVKSFMNDVISFDGPPLDFTNKKVKDLKDLLTLEPRSGHRIAIKKNVDQKKVKNKFEVDAARVFESDDEKSSRTDLDKDTKEKSKAEGESEVKPAVKKVTNLAPPNHIKTLISQHNVTFNSHNINNRGEHEGQIGDQKKKRKIKLVSVSLLLGYNEIREISTIEPTICSIFPNAYQNLQWLDLQHNYLVSLNHSLCNFPNLKSIYLHCNYIYDLREFFKLSKLENLRNLTVHGNPIDRIDGFRLILIAVFPSLKKLDTVLVTKKEIDNSNYISGLLGLDLDEYIYLNELEPEEAEKIRKENKKQKKNKKKLKGLVYEGKDLPHPPKPEG